MKQFETTGLSFRHAECESVTPKNFPNTMNLYNENLYSPSSAYIEMIKERQKNICNSERRADVKAAILKVWRHISDPTPSIDEHLTCMSNVIPIRFKTCGVFLFEERCPNKNNINNSQMSSDIGSVPGPKSPFVTKSSDHILLAADCRGGIIYASRMTATRWKESYDIIFIHHRW